jgi:hypothetical protein
MLMEVIIKGEKQKRQVKEIRPSNIPGGMPLLIPVTHREERYVHTIAGDVHIIDLSYSPLRDAKYSDASIKPWNKLP